MNEHKIRVALADDQRLLRDGLRIILEAAPDIEVVGEAGDGIEATQLDCVLLYGQLLVDRCCYRPIARRSCWQV